MRIYREKTKNIIVALMMFLSLGLITSCQKESVQDESSTLAPDECLINLSIPESEEREIITRSAAEFGESYIEDLYVLCFDNQNVFKKGEVLSIGRAISSENIITKGISGTLGKVILIANSEKFNSSVAADNTPAKKTERLNSGMIGKTIDDINELFMDSWPKFSLSGQPGNNSGKYMPMSSQIYKYTSRPGATAIPMELTRAYAKIRLTYDIAPENDATGLFTKQADINKHYYWVQYPPKVGSNYIYREQTSAITTPAINNADFSDWSSDLAPTNNMAEQDHKKLYYLPEFLNKTRAKGQEVDSMRWDANRMSISLRVKNADESKVQYYRLDFCQKDANGQYKFLDIVRNMSYTIKITAVKGFGYSTWEEAQRAPGSNIEYTIDVAEDKSVVTSNGQYAISMSNDAKIIKGDVGTYDVATVSYHAPAGVDLSNIAANSSVTTDMPSSPNVQLLFNGVSITKDMANPAKFVAGSNAIQLKVQTGTLVDHKVYLQFGNIKDTIVVKSYPYSQDKVEMDLISADVPKAIWTKNEANVSVSQAELYVPYRLHKVDGYTEGVISGKFRLGGPNTASDKIAKEPISTRAHIEIRQQGVNGVLTRFFTNQPNGQLTINDGPVIATPTKGINKIMSPVEGPVKVKAITYVSGSDQYPAEKWMRGGVEVPTAAGAATGQPFVTKVNDYVELTVPNSEVNAGDYTAVFGAARPAKVTLTFDSGLAKNPEKWPSDLTDQEIGTSVRLDIPYQQYRQPNFNTKINDASVLYEQAIDVRFMYVIAWYDTAGKMYGPGDFYTIKPENNILTPRWTEHITQYSKYEMVFFPPDGMVKFYTYYYPDIDYWIWLPPATRFQTKWIWTDPDDRTMYYFDCSKGWLPGAYSNAAPGQSSTGYTNVRQLRGLSSKGYTQNSIAFTCDDL